MQASSAFNPQSTFSHPIYHLFIVTLVLMAAILILVTGLITYIVIRYRGQNRVPIPNFGNRRLEIVWTVLPILLLAFLFVLTMNTMRASDPSGNTQQPDLIVTGHQWWWQVQYPASGVTTANEIHIPVRRKLLVRLASGDVIHDFWVPQLARKEDMIPRFQNQIWLSADLPGIYSGACAEYCGTEHAWMRIRVVAQTEDDFARWIQEQTRNPASPESHDAMAGALLFQQLTCANCHAVRGTSADQHIGPDLTHVASRETLAAGALQNKPENLAAWLRNPDQFKPGSHMPNLQLKEDQTREITAYLETLR